MHTNKLLTKSLFTTSLGCPRKLYYATHKEYVNANDGNDFMRSLAEGGIQVGALARHYYFSKYNTFSQHYIKAKDTAKALEETRLAMQETNVVIAEAAFEWNGCLVRADILVKRGSTIELIEVKSSSLHKKDEDKITEPTKKNEINSSYRDYIYDLAFQKYVIQNALNTDVHGYLMLINVDQMCDVDGLNQMVRINTKTQQVDATGLENYKVSPNEADWLLYPCDMDMVCNAIIAGETSEQAEYMGATFVDYVDLLLNALQTDTPAEPKISSQCKGCEFRSEDMSRSGFHRCWRECANFTYEDFQKPLTLELWGGGGFRNMKNLIAQKSYFMCDLQPSDYYNPKHAPFCTTDEYFNASARRQVQIECQTSERKDAILLSGIKSEMADWKFPLHFIDFETSTVALPFTKGRSPYETTAFQFSHHQLDQNHNLTHTEWISTECKFPNFDFVRALKHDLKNDDGTIFRYSHHENSVLNQIAEQLQNSQEADKEELIEFIYSITHDSGKKREGGKRDMVDLCEVVQHYFYDPVMKGSNSIKVVLPAVLRSKELQRMYQGPYRNYVESKNFETFDFSLINYTNEEQSEVGNPYKYLPTIGAELLEEGEISDSEERINNGGLANANYAKLQYDGLSADEKEKLKNALLRYCELDTMAMVLIYDYFDIHSK
ncbi:MAG: DUF2779 domain-containing protein [Alistipes sp.]|nr:DUF2779 domain-containing protein [Alistipes sp.]